MLENRCDAGTGGNISGAEPVTSGCSDQWGEKNATVQNKIIASLLLQSMVKIYKVIYDDFGSVFTY